MKISIQQIIYYSSSNKVEDFQGILLNVNGEMISVSRECWELEQAGEMKVEERWTSLFDSIKEYKHNALELPDDCSLISPIALVATQKRRLLALQGIYRHFLTLAHLETISGERSSANTRQFLLDLKEIFIAANISQWTPCEAHCFGTLVSKALAVFKAEFHLISDFISKASDDFKSFDPASHLKHNSLRCSCIFLNVFFTQFPAETNFRANDITQQCILVLRHFRNDFSIRPALEDCLGLLECIIQNSHKSLNPKLVASLLLHLPTFIKAKNDEIAIDAWKVYEVYFSHIKPSKSQMKHALGLLCGRVSFLLAERKLQSRLLESYFLYCLDSKMLPSAMISRSSEKVLKNSNYDSRLCIDGMTNVILEQNLSKVELERVLLNLVPVDGRLFFVSPGSISILIRDLVFNSRSFQDSLEMFDYLLQFSKEHFKPLPSIYLCSAINQFKSLHDQFPECLLKTNAMFDFLLIPDDEIQSQAVELIETVFKDNPVYMSTQVTLLFAQLKGDMIGLLNHESISLSLVSGRFKLFSAFLSILVDDFSVYCDQHIISRVYDWILHLLSDPDFKRFLLDNSSICEVVVASVRCVSTIDCDSVAVRLIDLLKASTNLGVVKSIFEIISHILKMGIKPQAVVFKLLNQCFHSLNLLPIRDLLFDKSDLVVILRLLKFIAEDKARPIDIQVVVSTSSKLIAHSHVFPCSSEETYKFHFYFGKLFWRSSFEVQSYCFTLFVSCVINSNNDMPPMILHALEAVLSSDVKNLPAVQQNFIIEKSQTILKEFMKSPSLSIKLQCGHIIGLVARLLALADDLNGINVLYGQIMQNAMTLSGLENHNRASFIVGVASLKAYLQLENYRWDEINHQSLFGLLASWSRESADPSVKTAVLHALSLYMELCGGLLDVDFFISSCELLLEHYLSDYKKPVVCTEIPRILNSIGLYVNAHPGLLVYYNRVVSIIFESQYFVRDYFSYLGISESYPQAIVPSSITFESIRTSLRNVDRHGLLQILNYLSKQFLLEPSVIDEFLDSELLEILLLEVGSKLEFSNDYQVVEAVLKETFCKSLPKYHNYIFNNVLRQLLVADNDPLTEVKIGDGAEDPMNNLIASERLRYSPLTLLYCLNPLCDNLPCLKDLPSDVLESVLTLLTKMCFHIVSVRHPRRKCFVDALNLLKSILKTFGHVADSRQANSLLLAQYDSQISSIISMTSNIDESHDPIFASIAYQCLFELVCSREDLHSAIGQDSGRIFSLLSKASAFLMTRELSQNQVSARDLPYLSIAVGFSRLHLMLNSLHDIDPELDSKLKIAIVSIFSKFPTYSGYLDLGDVVVLFKSWLKVSEDAVPNLKEVLIYLNGKLDSDTNIVSELISIMLTSSTSSDDSEMIKLIQRIIYISHQNLSSSILATVRSLIAKVRNSQQLAELKSTLSNITCSFLDGHIDQQRLEYGLVLMECWIKVVENPINDEYSFLQFLLNLAKGCVDFLASVSDVADSKSVLVHFKQLVSAKCECEGHRELLADLLTHIEGVCREHNSAFLMQLYFFCLCSKPDAWNQDLIDGSFKLFMDRLSDSDGFDLALDSWILLLKAWTRLDSGSDSKFSMLVNLVNEEIGKAALSHKSSESMQRALNLAEEILKNSPRKVKFVAKNVSDAEVDDEFK